MPSSRLAPSRRKRNSKPNAVDILNSLNTKKTTVPDDRLTQSARPSRQLQNVPRAPRRDIFEIPVEPSSERARRPTMQSSPTAADNLRHPRRRHDIWDPVSSPKDSQSLVPESQPSVPASRSKPRQSTLAPENSQQASGSPKRRRARAARSSPSSPPVAETPQRRSTRLQSRATVLDSPSRRSTRSNVNYREKRLDVMGSEQESDEEPAGSSEETSGEGPTDDQSEENDLNISLLSGDERYPSPSALQLGQNLEQSGRFGSSPFTPQRAEVPEQRQNTSKGKRILKEATLVSSGPPSRPAEPVPSVLIRGNANTVAETPLRRQETRPGRSASASKEVDGDIEMSEAVNEPTDMEIGDDLSEVVNKNDKNAGSDYEDSPAASSISSSGSDLFVRQDSPEPRRRSSRKEPSIGGHELRSGNSVTVPTARDETASLESSEPSEPSEPEIRHPSPKEPSNRSRQPVGRPISPPLKSPPRRPARNATSEELSGTLETRRIRNRRSRMVIRRPHQGTFEQHSPEPESKYPRCKDAMKFGGQQQNWKVLIDEARKMRRSARSSRRDNYKDILDLLDEQRHWYGNLRKRSRAPTISNSKARKYESWLDGIQQEADSILDSVYHEAKQGTRKQARKWFDGFEALAIPAIIELIFTVFDAYHSKPKCGFIYNHLERVLSLLLKICLRMTALNKGGYAPGVTRIRNLPGPLESLIGAWKSKQLLHVELESSGQDSEASDALDEEMPLYMMQRPWTDEQGLALMNGLEKHHGPGRYALIMRDYRDKLNGRTMADLREKAIEVYEMFVPTIQDEIQTREGREQWHWLLSVRE